MSSHLDFGDTQRGAVIPADGKTRVSIYLDDAVVAHFRSLATDSGRGLQSVISDALKAQAALSAAPGCAAPSPQQPAEPLVMRNMGDSEATFIVDAERLNCPACGGSGHVDDAKPAEPQQDGGAVRDHAERALTLCIAELLNLIDLAADYDFDEQTIATFETAIESMQMRLTTPQPAARRVTDGVDWRWNFVVISGLRYMDNNPSLALNEARAMADQDALRLESFANGGA